MSETTECAKRAVRIKALRAKADSTEYPKEAATLREKADELQAKNDAVGYRDPEEAERRRTVFDSLWDEYMRKKDRDKRIKRYQEHIRRQQSGEAHPVECVCNQCLAVDPMKIFRNFGARFDDEGQAHYDHVKPKPKRSRTQSTGERRARTDHSECYANGWHDKSKAGRAQCRRGTV